MKISKTLTHQFTDASDTRPAKRVKLARAPDGKIPYELDFTLKVISEREILSVEFVNEHDENEAEKTDGKEEGKYFAQVMRNFD